MSTEIQHLQVFTDFERLFPFGIRAFVLDFDKVVIENDSYQILYEMLSGTDGEQVYQQFLDDLENGYRLAQNDAQRDVVFYVAYQKFKIGVLNLLRSKNLATQENTSTIIEKFILRKGASEAFQLAKELGIILIIISAGVHIIQKFVEKTLPIVDEVFTNTTLLFNEAGQVYDFHQHPNFSEYKVQQLLIAQAHHNFSLRDTMGFGDSGYDIGFIDQIQKAGGLGVAVASNHTELRSIARAEITDFTDVVYFLTQYEHFAESRGLLRSRMNG